MGSSRLVLATFIDYTFKKNFLSPWKNEDYFKFEFEKNYFLVNKLKKLKRYKEHFLKSAIRWL